LLIARVATITTQPVWWSGMHGGQYAQYISVKTLWSLLHCWVQQQKDKTVTRSFCILISRRKVDY